MADTTFSNGTVIEPAWAQDVNDLVYRFTQSGSGAVPRAAQEKLRESVSVKDFGAVGTANIANEAADTAAFLAALATGKSVYVPEGTYYISQSLTVGANAQLIGAGKGKVTLIYSGTAHAVRVGDGSAGIVLTYNPKLGGMTIACSNRAATVNGVILENAVYFEVFDLTIIGSGNPNSAVPSENALYGAGLSVSHNSILGEIRGVSCRIWNYGYYFWTKAASGSHWSAAIEVHAGEVGNNMYGIVVGDPAVALPTAVGVTFHDIWVQGNYTTGIRNYSGEQATFNNIYFEGNANYDYDQGGGAALPVKCSLIHSPMNTEGIGTTNYGTFPYLTKIRIRTGSFTLIDDNDISVSTAIPLVQVDAAAQETRIYRNRLNSAIAAASRISNASSTTITVDNSPEAATVAIGQITRGLALASGNVAYTGLGFKPTSIEFWGAVDTQIEMMQGACGLTNSGYSNRCMTTDSAGAILSSSDCIRLIRSSAGNEQKAVLSSFDNDGFTLTWTKVGSPPANDLIVNYIARR